MNINAESIQRKEFHIVFKGYKPEEVDKFLDILAAEFNRLQKSKKELQSNLDSLKYEGDNESIKMKKIIQEALVSAHKVAEDIKQKAKKEAEEMIDNKRVEEEELYRELLSRKVELEKYIKELKQEYENFKNKISKLVDDFRETALKIGEIKPPDTSEAEEKDFDISSLGMDGDTGEGEEAARSQEKELGARGSIEDEGETEEKVEGEEEEEYN